MMEAVSPPQAGPSSPRPILVQEARSGWTSLDWRELWRYRELLYFLTWRDIKVRYKQTAMGAAWAILQPFMTMVVFTVFFGRLAGLENRTGGIPYPVFLYAGLLPWMFFSAAVGSCGQSVVGSSNLITKVYFPRLIIPLSSIGAGLVDLGISFLVFLGIMAFYHQALSWQVLLLPLFLGGTILAAAGVGTLLSALTVAYRDFRFVVPFLMQLWLYVSPVIYPTKLLSPEWRWVLALNPMSGLIDGFRAAFLGSALDWPRIGLSLGMALLFFVVGSAYFRKQEDDFADII